MGFASILGLGTPCEPTLTSLSPSFVECGHESLQIKQEIAMPPTHSRRISKCTCDLELSYMTSGLVYTEATEAMALEKPWILIS